jgi:hypothetical protein
MIRLIIRFAFWGTLLVAVLPGARNQGVYNGEIGPMMLVNAVQATVSDLGSFCTRNSSACQTGKAFFGQMASNAQKSITTALAAIQQPNDGVDRETMTGSVKK